MINLKHFDLTRTFDQRLMLGNPDELINARGSGATATNGQQQGNVAGTVNPQQKFAFHTGYTWDRGLSEEENKRKYADVYRRTAAQNGITTNPNYDKLYQDAEFDRYWQAKRNSSNRNPYTTGTVNGKTYNLAQSEQSAKEGDYYKRNNKIYYRGKRNDRPVAYGVKATFNKQGGSLQKFQQGGQIDEEDQLLAAGTLGIIGSAQDNQQEMDFATAAQQAVELYQKAPEKFQQLIQNKKLVSIGVQIMKQKEPDTLGLLYKEGFKKTISRMKKMKQGSKLEYIKNLKGICPEGYETTYMKAGGKVCPVCKKKKAAEKRAMKSEIPADKQGGAISELMNQIKANLFAEGGSVENKQKQQQPKKKITYTDGNNHYEYPDSAAYNSHIPVLKKLKASGLKSLTPEEKKRLADGNKYTVSSDTQV